jgi:hypothetical protein
MNHSLANKRPLWQRARREFLSCFPALLFFDDGGALNENISASVLSMPFFYRDYDLIVSTKRSSEQI